MTALATLELGSGGRLEFLQRPRAEVGQGVALEPGPEIFHRVQIGRVGGQQSHLDSALRAVEVVAHDAALVLCRAVPDDEQLALQVCAKRLEELDDLAVLEWKRKTWPALKKSVPPSDG